MNHKLLKAWHVFLFLLVLASMLISLTSCGVAAINEPVEVPVLNASIAVDPCEDIAYCTKVRVSEFKNGDTVATIYGKQSTYEIRFAETSIIGPFTPFVLTVEDVFMVPEISGCSLVDWGITENETDVVDILYVFSCG